MGRSHSRTAVNIPQSTGVPQLPRHKLIILGSGSVGKTAVFKSIKRLNEGTLQHENLEAETAIIRRQLVMGILALLKKSQELYDSYDEKYDPLSASHEIVHGYEWYADRKLMLCHIHSIEEVTPAIQLIVNYGPETFENPSDLNWNELQRLADAIEKIWRLPAIQQTFQLRLKKWYSLPSNAAYFFGKVHECFAQSYVPTQQDYLKLRWRTSGPARYEYSDSDKEKHFTVIDVGGARSERLKWIHSLDGIAAVLFVCALDQYCSPIFEDEKQLGMLENLQLFYELLHCKYLRKSEFVLLLNKMDLFREALKVTSLTFCFGDEYKGSNYGQNSQPWILRLMKRFTDCLGVSPIDCNEGAVPDDVLLIIGDYYDVLQKHVDEACLDLCVEDGIKFITQRFLDLNADNEDRVIFVHQICAIDPVQIEKVMWDVQNIVVRHNIRMQSFILN